MKSILRKITLAFSALVLSGGMTLAVALPVNAVSCDSGVGKGVALTDENGLCEDTGQGSDSLSAVIKKVIDIFSILVGSISVIMVIIGGFRYVVSNGDSNGVSGAKNTILYAIVGLVIVLFAQVIVRFVLTNVSPQ